MKKLQIGLIGAGNMARAHTRCLLAAHQDDMEIVAMADPTESETVKTLDLLKEAPPPVFAEYREMLNQVDLDAVIVAIPNDLHAEASIAAMESGKHVLCEKPIATRVEDAARMAEVSEQTGRMLMIGFEYRYCSYVHRLREIVQTRLGRLVSMWCREFRHPFQTKVGNWIQDSRRSGGTLNEKMCHHFDVLNWMAGAPPARVAAFGGNDVIHVINTPDEAMDNAWVVIEYANGVRAMVGVCMFAPYKMDRRHEFGFIGDRGILEGNDDLYEAVLWLRETEADAAMRKRNSAPYPKSESVTWRMAQNPDDQGEWGLAAEAAEFVACVRDGRAPISQISSVLDSIRVSLAAEQSIREGRMITVA